jgi:hypothetical protein
MKNKYIGLLAIWMGLFYFVSCDDFMDVHKKYVESDEIIYAPKVDSMQFIGGREKILFRVWLRNSPNVRSVDVFYNNRVDSVIIPVTPSAELDSVNYILPDMGESSYTFEVRTTDSYGHHSLPTTGVGTSYGDAFQSTLNKRLIGGVSINEKLSQTQIAWLSAAESLLFSEIRYTTTGNETKIIKVKPNESSTSIADAADGSVFEYRSLFLPEPNAIDTFKFDWERTVDPDVFFNQTNWEVIQVSDANADYPETNIIDDNLSSFWHSEYSPMSPFPHWVVIDMKSQKNITQIDTYRRNNNRDSKTIRYFVSDDPDPNATTWVQIGNDVVFPSATTPQMLTTTIPYPDPANKKRYLKLYLPDTNNTGSGSTSVSIAEINAYGSY